MKNYVDKAVKPGDDFFKFATGKWLEENPQPKEYPVWQTFTKLADENIHRINDIIQNPDDSVVGRKINLLYKIIMDDERRQREGIEGVEKFIAENVDPLSTREQIVEYMAKNRVNPFFSLFIGVDDKDNKNHIIETWQGGLSLGNKEYYLSKDPDKRKILNAFRKYLRKLLKYYGWDKDRAAEFIKGLVKTETGMARVSYSVEEQQEPSINYHKRAVSEIEEMADFKFKKFLEEYGYGETDTVLVAQEEPLKKACFYLNTLPVEFLKDMLRYHYMDASAAITNDELYDIEFEFSKAFQGEHEKMPKWKRAVGSVNSICSDAIGQVYVKKYFSEDDKKSVEELVKNLIASYGEIIAAQGWMCGETKDLALKKLGRMKVKVGYPNKFVDLSGMPVEEGKSYFETLLALEPYFFEIDKRLHYNKPVDPDEWHMSPQTVNAYYSPAENEIVFPAGILAEPFYSSRQTSAENYGGIGVVIGHEMTHGFDNHGRQYNVDGELFDWWTKWDVDKFTEYTRITKDHFDSLEVLPGLHCDGGLTLGENLADFGGLKIAYNALANLDDDADYIEFTRDQTFFISYAGVWAGISTEESIRQKTLNNEHSVNYMRVNGTLPMFTPWYVAFGIGDGDPMYVAPENRAKVW